MQRASKFHRSTNQCHTKHPQRNVYHSQMQTGFHRDLRDRQAEGLLFWKPSWNKLLRFMKPDAESPAVWFCRDWGCRLL